MNHQRLKVAIREGRICSQHTWMGFGITRSSPVPMVSIPLETFNLLLKAANKELARS